jgi:hypothetical protein
LKELMAKLERMESEKKKELEEAESRRKRLE